MCYWTEECWRTFKDTLELLERQFIPVKTLKVNRKKPIWMTHKAHRAVNRKRQVYRKYKDANHPAYVQFAPSGKQNHSQEQPKESLSVN